MHRRSFSGCDPPSFQGNIPAFSRSDWGRPNRGVSPLNRQVNSTPCVQRTPSIIRLQERPSRGISPLNRPKTLVASRSVPPLNRSESLVPSRNASLLVRPENLVHRGGESQLNCPAHLDHSSRGGSPLNRPDNWTSQKQNQTYGHRHKKPLIRPQDVPLPVQSEPRRERSRNWTSTKRRLQLTPQKQDRIKAWYEEYEGNTRLPHSNAKKQKSVHFSPSTLDSSKKRQKNGIRKWRYKNPRRRRPVRKYIARLRVDQQAEDESATRSFNQKPAIAPSKTEDTDHTVTVRVPNLIPADVALPDSDSSSDSESSCSPSYSTTSCSTFLWSCSSSSDLDIESKDEPDVAALVAEPGKVANPNTQPGTSEHTTAFQQYMGNLTNQPSNVSDHLSLPPRKFYRTEKAVPNFEADLIFEQVDLLSKTPFVSEETSNQTDTNLKITFPMCGTSSLAASVSPQTYTESMLFDIRHKPQKKALLPWYDEDKLDADPEVVLPSPPLHPIFPYCSIDINGFLSPVMARLNLNELDMMYIESGNKAQSSSSGSTNARKRRGADVMETDEARRPSDKMADNNKRQKLELLDKAEKKQKEMRFILEDIKVKVTTRSQQLQQWARKRCQQLRKWSRSKASSSSSCRKQQLMRKAADDSESCKKSKYCWEKN